jgi:hypothetical protein
MMPNLVRMALALLALVVTVSYAEQGPQRTMLEAFTITLTPFENVLSNQETTKVRNTVETLLSNFLTVYPWPTGTSVTFVGLARVLENTVNNDAVQVTMDGLVYFSITGNSNANMATAPPDSAAMNLLLQRALTPEALLEALLGDFSDLTAAELDVHNMVMPLALPSAAPSLAPSTLPPQVDVDVVVAGIVEATTPMQETQSNTGGLVGMVLGGIVALLCGIVLLSLLLKRRSKVMTEWNTEDVHVLPVREKRQLPSPTKTVATSRTEEDNDYSYGSNDNVERNVIPTSCLGNLFTTRFQTTTQMMNEDELSELDFNMDDLVSDFDDTVSIQPHIIAVEPVESFEHARSKHVLKKDMLDMSMMGSAVPYWLGTSDKTHPCALEPTDVSAATLAIKTKSKSTTNTRRSSLVPKVSWWSNAQQSQQPRDGFESSNDADTSFGGGCDWDPDDHSIATMEDRSNNNVFLATVENKDEQSLLQHSLRNESYKMQRLRTPDRITVMHHDDQYSSDDEHDYDATCIL